MLADIVHVFQRQDVGVHIAEGMMQAWSDQLDAMKAGLPVSVCAA
jgi:hypothetical protein